LTYITNPDNKLCSWNFKCNRKLKTIHQLLNFTKPHFLMQRDFDRLFLGDGLDEKFQKLGHLDLYLIPNPLTVRPVGQKYKTGKVYTG